MKKSLNNVAIACFLASMPLLCFGESKTGKEESAWVAYKNNERAFEISFPTGSKIVRDEPDYLRIQNYDPSEAGEELKPGQYYLEIHFRNSKETCDKWIESPKKLKVGKTIAMIGRDNDEGDAGGTRFILCAPRQQHLFAAVATDSDASGRIANRVLHSIRFTK